MPDSTPFQIDYQLTRNDLVCFWRERWGERTFRRGVWAFYVLGICWMVGSSIWNARAIHRSASDLRDEIAVETGIVLVFCGLTKWWLPPVGAFSQSLRRGSTGSFSVRISPRSLTAQTRDSEREIAWSELVGVKRTPGYVLLFGPEGRFYPIPVHAFPSTETADAFYQSAYDWHAEAKVKAKA